MRLTEEQIATHAAKYCEPAVGLIRKVLEKQARAMIREMQEHFTQKPPHIVMVCGVDCHPSDAVCNNYCNLAPRLGPMAPRPPAGPDATVGAEHE